MPCTGPDRDEAWKRADIEFEKIWKQLLIDNKLEVGGKFGGDISSAKENMRESIREIFWIDACNSW